MGLSPVQITLYTNLRLHIYLLNIIILGIGQLKKKLYSTLAPSR